MGGKLFEEPAGPAKRIWYINGHYTSDNITCAACGTEHSYKNLDQEAGEVRYYSVINGTLIVNECCGAEIDRLFETLGPDFFVQTIADFGDDPLAEKYSFVRRNLELGVTALNKAAKKAPKLAKSLKKLLQKI